MLLRQRLLDRADAVL